MFNPQDLEDKRLGHVLPLAHRRPPQQSRSTPQSRRAPNSATTSPANSQLPSQHPWFGEVGVGSVRTRGVLLDDTTHRALIEVIWSGTRFITQNNTPQPTNETGVIHSLFVLTRSPAARTNPDISVSSAHCPKCGAPVDSSASSNCAYCNTPLTTGDQSWSSQMSIPCLPPNRHPS